MAVPTGQSRPQCSCSSFDAVPRTYRLDIKEAARRNYQTKDVLAGSRLKCNGCKISYGRGLASGRHSIDLLSAISVPLTDIRRRSVPSPGEKRGFGFITSIPAGINCPQV